MLSARYVATEFAYAGERIPVGTQLIISRLLERVSLSPVPQRIQPIGYGAMRPRYGVQVRIDEVR